MVLEPATNLPSLLRCIIQYFSHNSLSFEGLSSPSHAASSLLIWKKLRTHSVVPSGFLAVHTLSHTCMIYSACSSMAWDSDLSGQVGKHFLSLAEEVCRLHCGLSEWHWSSLTSHWWLVLLLTLRGLLPSQCTTTLPWPQKATKEGSIEDKNTEWCFLFLHIQSVLNHLLDVHWKSMHLR